MKERLCFFMFLIPILALSQDSLRNDNTGKYRISDRFSERKFYKVKESYQIDYVFLVKGDSFRVQINRDSTFPHESRLVSLRDTHNSKRIVTKIIFDKEEGLFEGGDNPQKYISYHYLNDKSSEIDWDGTGIIENDTMTWIHPMRSNYFYITQFNPFPYIKFPIKKNKTWNWDLTIHSKGDPKWRQWSEDTLVNSYTYKIIRRYKSTIDNNNCNCWVIKGVASNKVASTELLSHYCEKLGFIKYEYLNIDGSKLIMNIRKIR